MKENVKNTLKDIGSGAAIGVACAIPGVSGGTIAVQLHVYDKHLEHMNNLRKKFFTNLRALLPLIVGVIVGLVPALILFKLAFEGFVFGIVSLFAGFILGGFPGLLDEVKGKPKKWHYWLLLVVGFIIAAIFGIISGISEQLGTGFNLYEAFNMSIAEGAKGEWIPNGHVEWWIYLTLIPIGIIACSALIVPGISGSMILLVTGYYNPLLDSLEWVKDMFTGKASGEQIGSFFGIVICLLIGFIIGFFTIVKILAILFNKFRVPSFYAIIGFVLGSIVSLYYNNQIVAYYKLWMSGSTVPWFSWPVELSIAIILLLVGALISYQLVKIGRKQAKTE